MLKMVAKEDKPILVAREQPINYPRGFAKITLDFASKHR